MGLFDGTPLERPVLCERCLKDIKECNCPPEVIVEPDVAPEKLRLTVRVEKRKAGRFVTTISGLNCPESQTSKLFVELKNHLGAGGSCADGQIEIQGQHQAKVEEFLKGRSFKIAKGK